MFLSSLNNATDRVISMCESRDLNDELDNLEIAFKNDGYKRQKINRVNCSKNEIIWNTKLVKDTRKLLSRPKIDHFHEVVA